MATLKKGNILAHARASGKKVVFKKRSASSIVKKAVARSPAANKRTVVRKVAVKPATKKQFKYQLQVKKSEKGLWQKLLGADSLANVTAIAKMYARKFPRHAFRVV